MNNIKRENNKFNRSEKKLTMGQDHPPSDLYNYYLGVGIEGLID
jgi:hypothetical protein